MKCKLCNKKATAKVQLESQSGSIVEIEVCENHQNFFNNFPYISANGFSAEEYINFIDNLETFYLGNLDLKDELVEAGAEGEFDQYSRVLLVVGKLIDNMMQDPEALVYMMNLYYLHSSKKMN